MQKVARPIGDFPAEASARVRYVLTDIDDTLTTNGYLSAAAYDALWELHFAGLRVIPVTGRPAGWCDLIIREWPVDAVIGENGAFVYFRPALIEQAASLGGDSDGEKDRITTFTHPSVADEAVRARLDEVREAVLSEVPRSRVARDQFARIFDLAIDFREDPPELPLAEAQRIKSICERFGAQAKISSIHVNAWFGEYDKLSMARLFLATYLGMNDLDLTESVVYCGDSPNDEPMFRFFPLACAVANVARYLEFMEYRPAFVASKAGGEGFAEIVRVLLDRRKKSAVVR